MKKAKIEARLGYTIPIIEDKVRYDRIAENVAMVEGLIAAGHDTPENELRLQDLNEIKASMELWY